ncbi:D-alanyl-D-alanine endopeptidase [Chitinibacter sp. ZOR0017]|uniref:D-alanyl-D-alanine endopeptidase n=1 Tax=Chitinibacter sp. ZOR0017 TaxID=1339254 RepID=UPI000648C412|nr:D-alanyl-D-alanine endopeptidase [Chitinibacter sp. ZOR0017]
MPTLLRALCVIVSSAILATTPAFAASKSVEKTTASSKKATSSASKKKTASSKKATSKSAKRSNRSDVKREAIARARRDVQVTRVNANPVNLYSPGVQSQAAVVVNQQTGEVMYERNADQVVPIASITKLMTAMVVLDARLPLNELISITQDDVDTLKNTGSRLAVGTTLTRGEMLLLALMSSENRAASSLSHAYPGGREAFVRKMNEKAQQLGMTRSQFYDPTGLTPRNVATSRDLALMVKAAMRYPEIHQFSTSSEYTFVSNLTGHSMAYRNTNPLVKDPDWEIGVSKTGFINEAGRCIVMQAKINNMPVVMVLMDSAGKQTRIGDVQRVRRWIEETRQAGNLRAG